jgi:hypothetical protein
MPISSWRDIASERETAHLLKSKSMKRRLLEAGGRQHGLSLDETIAELGIRRRRVRGSRLVGGARPGRLPFGSCAWYGTFNGTGKPELKDER